MPHSTSTVAIITPSFAPDFNRCKLLHETIQRFAPPSVKHYVIVDRIDYSLFSQLKSSSTEICVVEDLLPWWIRKTPFRSPFWINVKGWPIRNWLLQQIIKIKFAQSMPEDIGIFVDSDVAFIRPFEVETFFCRGAVRMYCELGGNFNWMSTGHVKWHQTASRLLGLEPTPMPAPDYIGNLITWRKSNVVQMCDRIEQVNGQSWLQCITSNWNLSEYILYGTFVNRVIPNSSGHFLDANKLTLNYWEDQPMQPQELERFLQNLRPEHLAVMISAKARMDPTFYRAYLEKYMDRNTQFHHSELRMNSNSLG